MICNRFCVNTLNVSKASGDVATSGARFFISTSSISSKEGSSPSIVAAADELNVLNVRSNFGLPVDFLRLATASAMNAEA
jgi:hypothetical protein